MNRNELQYTDYRGDGHRRLKYTALAIGTVIAAALAFFLLLSLAEVIP